MRVEILKKLEKGDFEAINELYQQGFGRDKKLTEDTVRAVLDTGSDIFVVREENAIVAMTTIVYVQTISGLIAQIEHVVVAESHRGKGLGRLLMESAIARAKEKRARKIDLTSNPNREAANALYKKLGFELRDTNSYRMRL